MLTKNLTKKHIEKKFERLGLKCSQYAKYILDNNLLTSTKGKSHHHIFPISLFGENKYVIRLTKSEHTRLHLLLIADNLNQVKSLDFSYELAKLCLSCRITQYDCHGNRHIKPDDLKFYKKYQRQIMSLSSVYTGEKLRKLWKSKTIYRDDMTYKEYMINQFRQFWNSDEIYKDDMTYKEYMSDIISKRWNSDKIYKDGLTYKEYMSNMLSEKWDSDEIYKDDMTYKEYMSDMLSKRWNSNKVYKDGLTYKEYMSNIFSNVMKQLWASEDIYKDDLTYREYMSNVIRQFWASEEEYLDGMTYREYMISLVKQRWDSKKEYADGLTFKQYMGKIFKAVWDSDEEYKDGMTYREYMHLKWEDPEWVAWFSEIDSKAIKKKWEDPEYRKKSMKARHSKSFREKQRQLESDRWANCTEEEYKQWCEKIAEGTNKADKSKWGSKTKNLWKNKEYREHMELVHSKEYRLKHDPEFAKQEYERLLRNFKGDQLWLVEHLMDMEKYPSRAINRNLGYTRLYNHRYLLEMCGINFDFEKDLLRESQLFGEDFDDIPRIYYCEQDFPFKKFKKHIRNLFNDI